MELFRKRALDAQRHKLAGTPLGRSPIGSLYVWLFIVLAAGSLVFGAVAVPIPSQNRAPGWLTSDQGIAGDQDHLRAIVPISTDAVGRVRAGDKLRVSFSAFPTAKYGTLAGMVTRLEHGVAPGGPLSPSDLGTAIYASIEFDPDSNSRIPPDQLRPGMGIFVTLPASSETLFERVSSR